MVLLEHVDNVLLDLDDPIEAIEPLAHHGREILPVLGHAEVEQQLRPGGGMLDEKRPRGELGQPFKAVDRGAHQVRDLEVGYPRRGVDDLDRRDRSRRDVVGAEDGHID